LNNLEKPQISFVLPAYNEGRHIKDALDKMDASVRSMGINYEIIVVDDGSKDETVKEAFGYSKHNDHVKVISYYQNIGKGHALKIGFFEAVGEIVAFIDSDLDIDPFQIKKYINVLDRGDLVIASKKHPQSNVEAPLLRKFLSSGFNTLVRLLTGLDLKDTQTGLKACKRKSLEKVFSVLAVKRFAFDVELLAVANLYGLKIVEMPVNIQLKKSSFSIKEISNMFIDLLGITYRLRVTKQYLNVKLDNNID